MLAKLQFSGQAFLYTILVYDRMRIDVVGYLQYAIKFIFLVAK